MTLSNSPSAYPDKKAYIEKQLKAFDGELALIRAECGIAATKEMIKNLSQSEMVEQIYRLVSILPERFPQGHNSLEFSSGEVIHFYLGEEGIEVISASVHSIQFETKEEIVELYNTDRFGEHIIHAMADDSLCPGGKEKSPATHMRRVENFAKILSQKYDGINAIRLVVGAKGHDSGKMGETILNLPKSQGLTDEQVASKYDHSSVENEVVKEISDAFCRVNACTHHSMDDENKEHLNSLPGVNINLVSHTEAEEMLSSIPNMDPDLAANMGNDIKFIDAFDALATFRDYRAFVGSLMHGVHETVKKIAETKMSIGDAKNTMENVKILFENLDFWIDQLRRDEEGFIKRQSIEDGIIQKHFKMSISKLGETLDKHYNAPQFNVFLGHLLSQPVAQEILKRKDVLDKSLDIQWIEVCTDLGIHLRSNEDLRLMTEEDFVLSNPLPDFMTPVLKRFSYDKFLAFLQRFEKNILEENRRDEYQPAISEEDLEMIESLLEALDIEFNLDRANDNTHILDAEKVGFA